MNGHRINKLEQDVNSLKRKTSRALCNKGEVKEYTLAEIYELEPCGPMFAYVSDFNEIWFWNGDHWRIVPEVQEGAAVYEERVLTSTATTFSLYYLDSNLNTVYHGGPKANETGYLERYEDNVLLDKRVTNAGTGAWAVENFNWTTGATERKLRIYFPDTLKNPEIASAGQFNPSWGSFSNSGVYSYFKGDGASYWNAGDSVHPFEGPMDFQFVKSYPFCKNITIYGTSEDATEVPYEKIGVNFWNTRDYIAPSRWEDFNNIKFYYGELQIQGRCDNFVDTVDWAEFRTHVAPYMSILEYSYQNGRPVNFEDLDWFVYPESYLTLDLLYAYYLTGVGGVFPTTVPRLKNLSLINFQNIGIAGEITDLGALNRLRWFHVQNNAITSVADPFTISDACYYFRVDNNAITNAADINRILVAFDEAGRVITAPSGSNGVINLNGGTNAAPDNSSGGLDGLAAKANLISKGWTVTHN